MRTVNLFATALLAAWCGTAAAVTRPNVVIIYADDLGYGDLSCYGAHRVATPNVDNLARQGVRFVNAHAAAATSTPSRFSLLTGMYAFRQDGTGVANGDAAMIIDPGCYTLADAFHDAGYATAAIGKWHLGLGREAGRQDWNKPLDATPADLGFDYSYIMAATADRVPCVFIEDGMVACHDAAHPIEVSYTRPFDGVKTYRDDPSLAYKHQSSHGHDMAVVNGIGRIGYMKGGGSALWRDEDIADSIVAHAVQFIGRQEGRPFFLYLATNDIHVPRQPHERFRGKSPMGLRGEAIMQFDWTVGQVIKALEAAGQLGNTLVIVSSDNGPVVDDGYCDKAGELLGDHTPWGGMRGTKYSAYEAGTRVPLIVSWPDAVAGGTVSGALVSQVDLLRSLAAVVGGTVPDGAARDSRDYSSALLGRDPEGREWVVEQGYALAVRTGEWKYIAPSTYPAVVPWGAEVATGCDTVPQLYRIGNEHENVAEQCPDVVRRMQALLDAVVAGD